MYHYDDMIDTDSTRQITNMDRPQGYQVPVAMDISPPKQKRGSQGRTVNLSGQVRDQMEERRQRLQARQGSRNAQFGSVERYEQTQQYGHARCNRGLRKNIIPKNKTKKRFEYGDGNQNALPKTRLPKKLSKVQSKIKDHVAYFKQMARESTNRPMFNKEPIIYVNQR